MTRSSSVAYASGKVASSSSCVHGLADRLVSPSGGRATARAIRNAHLLLLAGMGHDLPRDLWPLLADAIARNAERASDE